MDVTKEKSRVFKSIGRCIYCGSDGNGEKLTREHIFAKGMGGGLIFLEASCSTCQTEIGKFEDACMRRTLLPYRIFSQLTQNSDNRPDRVPLLLDLDLKGPTTVAVEDHPKIVILPALPELPGILTGRASSPAVQFEYKIFGHPSILEETKKKLQQQQHVGIDLDGIAWLRMLAKIAHGYAVAELEADSFSPLLPDLILGRNLSLCSYLVGKYPEPWPIPENPPLAMIDCKNVDVNGQHFIAVIIRLFAELGPETPVYAIIAGTPIKA